MFSLTFSLVVREIVGLSFCVEAQSFLISIPNCFTFFFQPIAASEIHFRANACQIRISRGKNVHSKEETMFRALVDVICICLYCWLPKQNFFVDSFEPFLFACLLAFFPHTPIIWFARSRTTIEACENVVINNSFAAIIPFQFGERMAFYTTNKKIQIILSKSLTVKWER